LVVLIIGREFVVSGLRNIASAEGFTIDASELGKIKMISQVVAITAIIIASKYRDFEILRHIDSYVHFELLGKTMLYLVGFFAVLSMVQYFRRFWGKVDSSVKERQRRRHRLLLRRKMKRDVAAK
jgi:CDP-diacylglycerol--glycerol-3-phosphate 3-phosphatidyltransferase